MFLLLVYVVALSPLLDGQITTEYKDSLCPVAFYGEMFTMMSVEDVEDEIYICFKGNYTTYNTSNDCVLLPKLGSDEIRIRTLNSRKALNGYFSHRQGRASCLIICQLLSSGSEIVSLRFISAERQGVLQVSLKVSSRKTLKFMVNGVIVRKEKTSKRKNYDITFCRSSGDLLSSPSGTCTSNGFSMICDNKARLSITPCDLGKRCWGNGQCVNPRMCTISGSNIIGFFGNVTTITDRCAYILMSDAGVELLGIFRDRRRKDISLLDHVIIRTEGAEFILGQGGRVQMNRLTLSIHSYAQMFHQVEFSKDQTGVTANLLTSTLRKVSVFFDGYTAQIYVEGDESDLQGSCVNSTAMKSDNASSSSCEDVHLEPADPSIDCPAMTTHCDLLKDPPFTSCHDYVDPKPYISVCIATLCKYPAVDGLKCRFHDAYARACSLNVNITLEGWRSKGSCSPPQIFCPHIVCSAHEFCADGIGGGTRCFCRAIFASRHKSTNTLGESTICHQNSASLSLVGCLLEEKGIDYSALRLNDPSCRGHMDNHSHMLTFSFNETNTCGAEVMNNNSRIIFKNTIMIQSNTSGDIIRQNQFQLNFSCFYSQPDMKSMTFRIVDSTVVQQIASGAWNYSLSMKAFTDTYHNQPINANTRLVLGQKVWIELSTDRLDDKLVAIVVESCWATNQVSAIGGLRYNLIMNGCANPDDQTVTVTANGQGTSTYFSFNMFQFSGSSADVYLHCKLNLCGKTKNDKCIPICDQTATGRSRRSVVSRYIDDNPAVITMTWTN